MKVRRKGIGGRKEESDDMREGKGRGKRDAGLRRESKVRSGTEERKERKDW